MRGAEQAIQQRFVPEWCAAGALVLADCALLRLSGVRLVPSLGAYLLVPLLIVAARAARGRVALALDFLALLIVTDTAVRAATYAASAMAGPLWDARVAAADSALGFDWKRWFDFVTGHPGIGLALGFLYYRIGLIALLLAGLLAWRRDAQRLREMWWLLFLSSLLTVLGAYLLPVLGPYHTYNLSAHCGPFILELERLRAGRDLVFPLGALQGVIQCPSFHTTLALALAYGFRGTGRIGIVAAQLSLLLLLGVPVFGGHYLTDMLAGAGVMALSLGLVRGWKKISAGYAWPKSAARYAGACSISAPSR
jgi:hypothetical protein